MSARAGVIRTLVLVGALAAWPNRAKGCSCVEYLPDPSEALEKSSLVFAGEAVSTEVVTLPTITYIKGDDGKLEPHQYVDQRQVVRFKTLKEWKGDSAKEYVVIGGAPSDGPGTVVGSCDIHFEVGKKYLVFVEQYGLAFANPCAPTREMSKSRDEMAHLDNYVKTRGH